MNQISLHQLESIIFLIKLAVPSRKQISLSNWPPPSWVVNYVEIFWSLCMLYMSLTISVCLVLNNCYWVIVKIVLKMELIVEGSRLIHDRFILNEKVGYKQYMCVMLHCNKHFWLSEYLRGVPFAQDDRYIQKENGLTVLNWQF